MKVVLDVDGVLLNLNSAFIKWVKDYYGEGIYEDDIVHWDYHYTFGIPKSLSETMWTAMWSTPLKPFPDALEFIRRVKDRAEVLLVSNRPTDFYGADRAAHRDFPQLGCAYRLTDNTPKSEILKEWGADVFIDDNPNNCIEAMENWGGKTFLLTRYYNRNCRCVGDNVYSRVYGYEDAVEQIGRTK